MPVRAGGRPTGGRAGVVRRRVHIAQNLALTRNALLAIIPFGQTNRYRVGSRSTGATRPRPSDSSFTPPPFHGSSNQMPWARSVPTIFKVAKQPAPHQLPFVATTVGGLRIFSSASTLAVVFHASARPKDRIKRRGNRFPFRLLFRPS